MRRKRPLPTQQSQENLLSPRSLSHSMSSFNPSPRSLVESLDLSTAEETPRDDMAVSWPISPRYQWLNEEGSSRLLQGETGGESVRTPTTAEVLPVTPVTVTPMETQVDSRNNLVSATAVDKSEPEETPRGEASALSAHSSARDTATTGSDSLTPNVTPRPEASLLKLAIPEKHLNLDLNESMKSNASLSSLGSPQTPSATARTPRGGFMWRPVQPGYGQPEPTQLKPSVVIQQTVEVQQTLSQPDGSLKDSIPLLHKGLAIACFVLNALCPGLGTLVAGLSVLCCAKARPYEADKWNSVFVNSCVSLLQAMTTLLFLLGWVWSIMWGVAMVQISNEEKERLKRHRAADGVESVDNSINVSTSHVAHRTRTREISSATTMATSTTTLSYERDPSSVVADNNGSIIILQEAPVMVNPDSFDQLLPLQFPRSQRALNPYNPRHQRALRRQNTEEDLPPVFLSPETLESIVIPSASALPLGDNVEGSNGHRTAGSATDDTTTMGYTNLKAGTSRQQQS